MTNDIHFLQIELIGVQMTTYLHNYRLRLYLSSPFKHPSIPFPTWGYEIRKYRRETNRHDFLSASLLAQLKVKTQTD